MTRLVNLPTKKSKVPIEVHIARTNPGNEVFGFNLSAGDWLCTDTIQVEGLSESRLKYLGEEIARLVTRARDTGYVHAQVDMRNQLGIKQR